MRPVLPPTHVGEQRDDASSPAAAAYVPDVVAGCAEDNDVAVP